MQREVRDALLMLVSEAIAHAKARHVGDDDMAEAEWLSILELACAWLDAQPDAPAAHTLYLVAHWRNRPETAIDNSDTKIIAAYTDRAQADAHIARLEAEWGPYEDDADWADAQGWHVQTVEVVE